MLGMAACASLGSESKLTPLEQEALQTREYAVPAPKAFSVVSSTFQEMGYTVDKSDEAEGLILAHREYVASFWERLNEGSASTELLHGSAKLESIAPERTKVRMTMTKISVHNLGKTTLENKDGTTETVPMTMTEYSPFYRPGSYQTLFERLDTAFSAPQHSP